MRTKIINYDPDYLGGKSVEAEAIEREAAQIAETRIMWERQEIWRTLLTDDAIDKIDIAIFALRCFGLGWRDVFRIAGVKDRMGYYRMERIKEIYFNGEKK
jgi:hypothetical protein